MSAIARASSAMNLDEADQMLHNALEQLDDLLAKGNQCTHRRQTHTLRHCYGLKEFAKRTCSLLQISNTQSVV